MNAEKTGKLILSLRKEKGLTQSDLAQMLNISNRTVSKWENGDGFPDITILPNLVEILCITVDELLAGEKKESESPAESEVLFSASVPQSLKSYNKVFSLHTNRYVPKWCIAVLFAAVFIVVIAAFSMDIFTKSQTAVILSFYLFLFFVSIFQSRILSLSQISKIKAFNNGKLCDDEITVTANKMICETGISRNVFELNDITGFYDKGDIFVLRFHKRVYTYITKNSFTQGTAEDFEKFIRANMTSVKDKKSFAVFFKILTIILLCVTSAAVFFVCEFQATTYDYDDYIVMSADELSQLNDDNLYDAVAYRVDNKLFGRDEPLNEAENNYYLVYEFLGNYEAGGLQSEFYNMDADIDELHSALNAVGLYELSDKIQDFVNENNIDIMDFNSKADYEELNDKYPFDEIDEQIKNDCLNNVKNALTEYARNHINEF